MLYKVLILISKHTGWGKSKFIVVSTRNRVYPCIIIHCIIFCRNNCKPNFAHHVCETLNLGMWILWQQWESCSLSMDSQVWEPEHTLTMNTISRITEVVCITISEPNASLLLFIFRLFKNSSIKQDLYYVLNLSAESVKQYKVPD